ncbi:LacI family DNA-binding transcriptional regulator [Devosia sp. PTR5]|uniref:LacI family DNA-binding transcriptional regulator n=1 Tax=Devosia oryzisoli TaxID=2774138 RepID=A0A927FU25_9HYPH|nr:LacI family DNA-binding transcriptional regulator [Devosia oryzisoli]MBD8065159.1 LacI family DNA-binding transcriptional regulator [Devosia oryzisoli]
MARGAGKVGIKDVAGAADVSVSTVSHVLNGTAPISAEVRARVLDAASDLGYLAKRREKAAIAVIRSILLAVPSDTLPHSQYNLFSWTLLSTLMRECERRSIRVVPLEVDNPVVDAAQLVAEARAQDVDGILLLNEDRPDLLAEIAQSGIPAVLMNGEDQEMQIDSVTPGNRFAARYATNWLISQGHRNILHLTWEGRSTIRRRRDGFLDAFRANGLSLETAYIHHAAGYLPEMGAEAIRRWVDKHQGLGGITAVFCAADNLALGVMTALQQDGFSMPRDLSIVGFDGVALGEFVSPSLTTVSVPLDHIGLSALHLLEQRIVNAAAQPPAHRLELGCRLTVRKSVRVLT